MENQFKKSVHKRARVYSATPEDVDRMRPAQRQRPPQGSNSNFNNQSRRHKFVRPATKRVEAPLTLSDLKTRTAQPATSHPRPHSPVPMRQHAVHSHTTHHAAHGHSRPSSFERIARDGVKREKTEEKKKAIIPPLKDGDIRIIPLGGVEEVGKNMTILEYKGDIVIIDMGFQFPGEEVPGVDYIIPDISYLAERKDKIRGVFITHGHLDHIGGIPYMMDRIGNPPIYTRLMTAVLIKKRQSEFPNVPILNLQVIETNTTIPAGNLRVKFFNVTHTVPDSMGVIVETPYGNVIFAGDLKVDHIDQKVLPEEEATYDALSRQKNLLLMSDSTNTWRAGWSHSEHTIQQNLREIIRNVPGRLVMGTFASLLIRIIFVIKTAEEFGKKVVIDGRGMVTNVDIAKELGLIKTDSSVFITPEQIDDYPPNQVIIIATGAQGDEYSALMRMGTKAHRKIKLHKGDMVLLSSSIIPGNEKKIQILKDNLARQGAKIMDYRLADIHSSGHANADEAAWIYRKIRPRFFMPCHAGYYMLSMNAELAQSTGIPPENTIIPENGMVIEIQNEGTKLVSLKEKAGNDIIMVDGLGTGDVNEVVIRDRKTLAEEGVFMVVVVVDQRTGKILRSPDIVSRGLVYLKESQEMLKQSRIIVRKCVEQSLEGMHPLNLDYAKNSIRENLGKFLYKQTNKRPVILPVVIEI